jgi:hypothetical protein
MNSHLNAAIAAGRQRDMEHAAGCCTLGAEHRDALWRSLRRRLPGLGVERRPVRSSVCCPAA